MNGTTFFLNFIPMVLFYLVATYSPEMAKWSHTILGKTIAVAIILLYGFTDTISGLLACAIVVFYYQSDYVEGFSPFLKEMYVKTDMTIIEMKEKENENPERHHDHLLSLADAYPSTP
jgi:hypothetical protein